MVILLRLALRDLAHQKAFSIFFVVNLALGLTGALLLDSLQGSVTRTLAERSRSMLGGDLRVSSTRALAAGEVAAMDAAAGASSSTDLVQLYSMVSGRTHARLVELRGVDRRFPLHGSIVLAGAGTADAAAHERLEKGAEAWADPSLLDQLGIALGDEIRVGTGTFRVTDTLLRDTGLSVRAASLAPRLYVSRALVEETGLIRTGSRIEYQHLAALPAGTDADAAARAMRGASSDARVRVTSHDEAVQEMTGAYSRVTRYLGLVSLVALALSGVASAYLFHAFLGRRLADLAILRSLGATRRSGQALLLMEVALLASLAAAVAVAFVTLMLPAVAALLSDLLPAELDLGVSAREAFVAFVVAIALGPVSCLPLLARLGTLRVSELFQEQLHFGLRRGRRDVLWALPAVALVVGLAVARVGDLRQGLWFSGGLLVALALASATGRLLLPLVARAGSRSRVSVRLALRRLSPRRRESRTAFVALTLAALLLVLPPQMRAILMNQLHPPGQDVIPSLFLFDIQPEQAEPLREHLAAAGTAWQRLAPMVRARLVSINDKAVGGADVPAEGPSRDLRDESAPRDPAEAQRLGSRHYNLTWQGELHTTEKLVAGSPFSGTWQADSGALPEISMEKDFARRLGVGLGDRLRFDVQGVPIDGRVVNLREVDWTSLQPNFFVSFQPGVLEDAPSVFLASVPSLAREDRDRLQVSIVEKFPNVSMIDVTRGVERALTLLSQLRWAVAATAWTALAVGLLLVFAIARDEAERRRWDFNLMKVLGARHGLLRASVAVEFAVLGAVAAAVGIAIGVAGAAAIALGVLEVPWQPAWLPLLLVAVVMPLVAAVTARLAMRRVLREKPLLGLG
ncbi:MAG: ABC transporter permease [Candidatus Binatia bacterium]